MDSGFIKDLLYSLQREAIQHRRACVIIFLVVCFLALVVGWLLPKNFKTDAILYADETNIIEPLLEGRAEVTEVDNVERAKEMIRTRRILSEVAKKSGMIKETDSVAKQERAVSSLRASVSVKKVGKTHFRISYSNSDPDVSFEVLRNTVNVFIEDAAKKKKDESVSAYRFIDSQVQSYKHQLELAEKNLKEFKSGNRDGTEGAVQKRIDKLRSDIEDIKLDIEDWQARISSIRQQMNSESKYQTAKGKADNLKKRRLVLTDELEQLQLLYQESYPDIVSLKAQIAEIDSSLADMGTFTGNVAGSGSEQSINPLFEELRKQKSDAEVNLKTQKRRLKSLKSLLEQEYERTERVASNQAELTELVRDYDVTREVYEEMLSRKESARLSMTLDLEGQGVAYKIQEPPVYPLQPSGIRFIHVAAIAPILALMIPLGLLLAYIMVDPRIRAVSSLKDMLPEGTELIGVVPHYNTPLAERLVKKDAVLLAITAGSGFCVYLLLVGIKVAIG